MGYKRKRIYAAGTSWGAKKRRSVRKSGHKGRSRRAPKTTVYSSRSLNPRDSRVKRGKKLSKRAWRNLLWRNTLTSTKYKSTLTTANTQSTPVGSITKSVVIYNALSDVATNEFYRVGGGLQDINFGITPNLGVDLSSVVIRGGIIQCNICATPSNTDAVIVNVELRRSKQNRRNAEDNANSNTLVNYVTAVQATNRNLTWTLDDHPDNQEYFSKTYLNKTMVLQPGQMFDVTHRLRVEKWDTVEFERGMKHFYWIVMVSQVVDLLGVAEGLNINLSHDLSFAASSDAI